MSIKTVSLSIVEAAPHLIGSQITISAEVKPTPSITAEFIWSDEEDTILNQGTNLMSLNYNIEDGKFRRLIKLTVVDTESYSSVIQFNVKYPEVVIPTPTALSGIKRKRNNLELHKILSNFPKWSFANQSFLSNAAKISEPIFNRLMETQAYAINMTAANMINAHETTEFLSTMYTSSFAREPLEVITDVGIFQHSGHVLENWFDSYPITNAYLLKSKAFNYSYQYVPTETFNRLSLPFETKLYVTLTDNVERDVTIVGINSKGQPIKETVNILPQVSSCTMNKYKAVIGIYADASFDISSYPKTDSYRSGYIDYKRIVDKAGDYFEPSFVIDGIDRNTIVVKNAFKDEYRFTTDHIIDKFVVTENLDILYISEQSLYACKPFLDTRLNLGLNSTFNNNTICNVNSEDSVMGENIIFTINIDRIKSLSDVFYLKLNDSYIDLLGNVLTTRKAFKAHQLPSAARFSKTKSNNEPYILSIEIENIQEVYKCGVVDNMLEPYKISDSVIDIFAFDGRIHVATSLDGNQLIANYGAYEYPAYIVDKDLNKITVQAPEHTDVNIYELIPIRPCFLIKDNELMFNTKVNILEHIYE